MTLTGTLKHVDVEGGTWLFVSADGRTFQLDRAPSHPAGTRVEVDGEPAPQGVSLQMAAPILKVRAMRKI